MADPDYTAQEFIAEYPHFGKTDQNWIATQIQYAKTMNSQATFGDSWRLAVGLYVAHMLSLSPRGQEARLDPDDGKTIYGLQYDQLVNTITAGPRII